MSSNEVVLKAETREISTRGDVNKLRREGKIPAVMYGNKEKSIPVVIDSKEFYLATHTDAGEHAIISLQLEDGSKKKSRNVIVKDIQVHPVKRSVLHVDFLQISLTQEIEVTVVVETVGLPQGVDMQGGVLDQIAREIKVKCLPAAIPDKIEVDVSEMNIHDSIKISDLKIPAKVEVLEDPDGIVAIVVPPTKIEEKPPEEEVEGEAEEGAEPTVIGKDKEEEEGEAGKAEGKGKPEEKGKPGEKGKPEEKGKLGEKGKPEEKGKLEEKGKPKDKK